VLTQVFRICQLGTTLIETMVAIAIFALLIALGVPALGDWLKNAQIRTAAESLQDGLQQARNEAVKRNVAVEFRLIGGSSWEVRLADTTVANRKLVSRPSSEGSPDVVLVQIPAAATMLTFDGMGRRYPSSKTNADGSAVLTTICVDLPSSVLPPARTHDLQLDVSLGGTVRMCDPKVSGSTDTRVCEGYPTTCTAL
jgi:type IV fimbrial biogenesis protein FimT